MTFPPQTAAIGNRNKVAVDDPRLAPQSDEAVACKQDTANFENALASSTDLPGRDRQRNGFAW